MDIKREDVVKRKSELEAKRDQLILDANAYAGAIQDCDYWLTVLDKVEEKAE